MTKNGKIGTHNGVDFYTSLDAMLEDGKELLDQENKQGGLTLGTNPYTCSLSFKDETGNLNNLKNEKQKAYNHALELISKINQGKEGKCSVITKSVEDTVAFATAIYSNGKVGVGEMKDISEGYRVAQGNLSVPYTMQAIKS